jgi:hypothetical protein
VFVAVVSAGDGEVIVQGRAQSWSYPITARNSGVMSVSPGKGIRESYLGFGYRNVAQAWPSASTASTPRSMHSNTRRK